MKDETEVLDDFPRNTMPAVVPGVQSILIPHCSRKWR
jgi:hypothetical protein